MIPLFTAIPVLPALLTCAAAWAIAIWALKQRDPLTRLVQSITGATDAAGPAENRKAVHSTSHEAAVVLVKHNGGLQS